MFPVVINTKVLFWIFEILLINFFMTLTISDNFTISDYGERSHGKNGKGWGESCWKSAFNLLGWSHRLQVGFGSVCRCRYGGWWNRKWQKIKLKWKKHNKQMDLGVPLRSCWKGCLSLYCALNVFYLSIGEFLHHVYFNFSYPGFYDHSITFQP